MQNITVENFGPIKKAEIALNELLIFIGPQASGKSTLSQLIYFFKSLREDVYRLAWQTDEDNGLSEERFHKEVKSKFVKIFGATKFMSPFFIQCQYSDNKLFTLTKREEYLDIQSNPTFEDNFNHLIQSKHEFDQQFAPTHFNSKRFSLSEDWRFQQEKSAYFKLLENQINTLFGENAAPIYIPASRSLLATLSEQLALLDKNNLDFLTEIFIVLITKLKPNKAEKKSFLTNKNLSLYN